MLYRGTVITSGTGAAVVVATGAQTELDLTPELLASISRVTFLGSHWTS